MILKSYLEIFSSHYAYKYASDMPSLIKKSILINPLTGLTGPSRISSEAVPISYAWMCQGCILETADGVQCRID